APPLEALRRRPAISPARSAEGGPSAPPRAEQRGRPTIDERVAEHVLSIHGARALRREELLRYGLPGARVRVAVTGSPQPCFFRAGQYHPLPVARVVTGRPTADRRRSASRSRPKSPVSITTSMAKPHTQAAEDLMMLGECLFLAGRAEKRRPPACGMRRGRDRGHAAIVRPRSG